MVKAGKKQAPARRAAKSATASKSMGAAKSGETGSRRPTIKRRALGPIGRLEDFIPYKLSVVANRVSQTIGRIFESQFNIQVPEWRIMMALYAYDRLVFNEVVERTSMDKARVSRAQRRLVDLQLVASSNDPSDGRKVILSLTAKGEKMCAEILPEAAKREAWYLEVLDDQEHRQLDVILDKLMKRSLQG